ncbi:Glutamine-dependent NAD(+) synthetase [Novipirellula aureliae]|uniref:Glutamine-dependent NAD(+) synthetase n=1 Tax=Novipirellula aureliae TaxID=2527966 RepID=A0A5C6DBE5_9BACT|nr:NAD(+) synthase [Novipirellula aureliae]TWU34182.1 Glutamine-dependent NAD(+) synthetase [Novipirellula aureliae]
MTRHGFFRISAASPAVSVANPEANGRATMQLIDKLDSDLVLFPELGLTGYTCGDLFAADSLIDATMVELVRIAESSASHNQIIVVGLPFRIDDSLMNVAAVLHAGRIKGIVPKSYLPTYREFYEGRHFRPASRHDPPHVIVDGQAIPFGTDLLFAFGDAVIAVEICEDLWTPIPPSSRAALAGANVLVNLSASNDTIGKAAWRRDLLRSQSGRCIAAYAYASAGPGESSSDLVFGGHCLIAEDGVLLDEARSLLAERPTSQTETVVTCDVDLQKLAHDRQVIGSFDDGKQSLQTEYRRVDLSRGPLRSNREDLQPRATLLRKVDAHPFVPKQSAELESRCEEIFAMQTVALTKRLARLPETTPLAIGISGGLDSTLALLVALRACDAMQRPRRSIIGLTMPGFGTTEHTKTSANDLIKLTGITGETIDIRDLCLNTFLAIRHKPLGISIDSSTTAESLQESLRDVPSDRGDLTFENVQARIRTMLLMSRGFVLGTGDMSEQALGWCTYNADHISMYNVNTSIPKTLVRFLVRFAADHYHEDPTTELLHRVADTPISPELLPPAADGSIRQETEASIGAYELHDFFLYQFVRYGFRREKILFLAKQASFSQPFENSLIEKTLAVFFDRFFKNQFKRNCVPDGPKVGSVSLSPRGDWRMPSDADSDAFL